MSGFEERFRKVGYKAPKPLIEIEGKPIIAHVIDMFPGEQEFITHHSQGGVVSAGPRNRHRCLRKDV